MSNIIRPGGYIVKEETKVVDLQSQPPRFSSNEHKDKTQKTIYNTSLEAETTLAEAQEQARLIIEDAIKEMNGLREVAKSDIDSWWEEKRQEDTRLVEDATQQGYTVGYEEGAKRAEQDVLDHYQGTLKEAGKITEQAILHKQQIISESEPFLIELGCHIAEKIIGHELDQNSEYLLELVRKVLTRQHEHGIITICVSPSQYSFICESKDELSMSVDSQAELNIVPDNTVKDHGCIVRSSFGSIDARIDTQLNEIKKVLVQIAQRNEDTQLHGEPS